MFNKNHKFMILEGTKNFSFQFAPNNTCNNVALEVKTAKNFLEKLTFYSIDISKLCKKDKYNNIGICYYTGIHWEMEITRKVVTKTPSFVSITFIHLFLFFP